MLQASSKNSSDVGYEPNTALCKNNEHCSKPERTFESAVRFVS